MIADSVLAKYKEYRNDPWLFLTECVYTIDQVDKKNPIKKYPSHRAYARFFVKCWQRYPLLAVPKSRRMTMSWTMMGLCAWELLFFKGRNWAMVSKKEDDADELVQRVKFILDNLPKDKIPRELIPKYSYKYCRLIMEGLYSELRGFPQGADQLRQFTCSQIFGDESAFWEHAKKFYAASMPTIDGGGRCCLVSSPGPGFFKKLCFDMIEHMETDFEVPETIDHAVTPMTGIRMWKNRKNKFLVFELHYTADPEKRHDGYRQSLIDTLPYTEYMREYELCWDTFEGLPVYGKDYNHQFHSTDKELRPEFGLPLILCLDFGLTPAAIVMQLQKDTLFVFREFIEVNMGIQRFKEQLVPQLRLLYREWGDFKNDWLTFIDPSGFFRNDTDEQSCALILNDAKKGGVSFNCQPGQITWEARKNAVYHFMKGFNSEGQSKLVISRKYCPTLVKGFQGGYMWPLKAADVEPTKLRPLKNAYSHPHDAFQYGCSGIIQKVNTHLGGAIPRPSYGGMNTQREKERNIMYGQIVARTS